MTLGLRTMVRRWLIRGAIAFTAFIFTLQVSLPTVSLWASFGHLNAPPRDTSVWLAPGWAQDSANPEKTTNDNSVAPASEPTDFQSEQTLQAEVDGFPVMLAGEELFVVQKRVGSFSAEDRANVMSQRIRALAVDRRTDPRKIQIEAQEQSTNLILDNKVLVTITNADADAARQSPQELATDYRNTIIAAVQQYRAARSKEVLTRGAVYTLASAIALILILFLLSRLFPWINRKISGWQNTLIRPIRIQNLELISEERTTSLLLGIVKLIRVILTLIILYIFVPLILSFFPWTKHLGQVLFAQIAAALRHMGQGFIGYLPNICIVAVVLLIAFYTIRFIRPIFNEIERGSLPIPGFYPEWAGPTFNLFRVLIIALALIIVIPYLPGSNSPAFQGISLFLGVLFSLGSTSAVANVVSGIILIYTRAFQVGDRVKIADAMGDVVEKTLLVTRLRTPKNVLITIPNAAVLGGNVINFSASVRETQQPLLLHATITLGYDVPWRKVYTVLISAAEATNDIVADPEPFVLQTSLDDFYVSYELNVYTREPGKIPRTYSHLYENIQDKCNEADIEILSPHYSAVRDGHHITIPENYLPHNYQPPGFRVHPLKKLLNLDSPSQD